MVGVERERTCQPFPGVAQSSHAGERTADPEADIGIAGFVQHLLDQRIEIRAMRKAERTGSAATGPGGDEGPVLENFIPAAYNDASQLTKTIEAPGPVVIDLDLMAQP